MRYFSRISHLNKEDLLKIIGGNIKLLRKYYGITSEELGKETGMGRTAISRIENGKINITMETLVVIANYFKVSPVLLLTINIRVKE